MTFLRFTKGFTLAEVLITLGIIGIIAAMTLPALIQKNNNKVVETRLKKFYSAINLAVLMAENDYGDKKDWYQDLPGAQIGSDGKPIAGSSKQEKWFKTYLQPYLNIVESEILSDGSYVVYFADGGALRFHNGTTRDCYFYPGKPKKCLEKYGTGFEGSGICQFSFIFYPNSKSATWKYHYNKGFEPYKYLWSGDIERLKNGHQEHSCNKSATSRNYCTALIQMNGWKIPDDYPFKVSY